MSDYALGEAQLALAAGGSDGDVDEIYRTAALLARASGHAYAHRHAQSHEGGWESCSLEALWRAVQYAESIVNRQRPDFAHLLPRAHLEMGRAQAIAIRASSTESAFESFATASRLANEALADQPPPIRSSLLRVVRDAHDARLRLRAREQWRASSGFGRDVRQALEASIELIDTAHEDLGHIAELAALGGPDSGAAALYHASENDIERLNDQLEKAVPFLCERDRGPATDERRFRESIMALYLETYLRLAPHFVPDIVSEQMSPAGENCASDSETMRELFSAAIGRALSRGDLKSKEARTRLEACLRELTRHE